MSFDGDSRATLKLIFKKIKFTIYFKSLLTEL